ncbi:MAG TPA: protein-L-isoaspartate(D-aspartate) O-methyltransferase [Burkholderiaceae bacterium]|nr:protein-L-isoaspartate(D-aspartate) O-methyltransferase [Burkholderiaceae bacterium]
MRKPLTPSPFAKGTTNRFGRSSLGHGYSASNSNARVVPPNRPASASKLAADTSTMVNLGLNSERSRGMMIQRLREQGIRDERVLAALMAVPRHLFVDQGLASRAYEDAALPIGYGQTISQPWVVARMLSVVSQNRDLGKVLEIGAGCGYQAAVLAQLATEVHSIERVRGLYELARGHLRSLKLISRVRLSFGDGMKGLPGVAPFDAIVVAAAGIEIPQPLLDQLAPGGRLIAPQGAASMQRLILVERVGPASWHREELDAVRFVPLRAGTQP